MNDLFEYIPEDIGADNDAVLALTAAVYALLARLKQEGLEDCTEFDQGVTALRHYEQLRYRHIAKVEHLLRSRSRSDQHRALSRYQTLDLWRKPSFN